MVCLLTCPKGLHGQEKQSGDFVKLSFIEEGEKIHSQSKVVFVN